LDDIGLSLLNAASDDFWNVDLFRTTAFPRRKADRDNTLGTFPFSYPSRMPREEFLVSSQT